MNSIPANIPISSGAFRFPTTLTTQYNSVDFAVVGNRMIYCYGLTSIGPFVKPNTNTIVVSLYEFSNIKTQKNYTILSSVMLTIDSSSPLVKIYKISATRFAVFNRLKVYIINMNGNSLELEAEQDNILFYDVLATLPASTNSLTELDAYSIKDNELLICTNANSNGTTTLYKLTFNTTTKVITLSSVPIDGNTLSGISSNFGSGFGKRFLFNVHKVPASSNFFVRVSLENASSGGNSILIFAAIVDQNFNFVLRPTIPNSSVSPSINFMTDAVALSNNRIIYVRAHGTECVYYVNGSYTVMGIESFTGNTNKIIQDIQPLGDDTYMLSYIAGATAGYRILRFANRLITNEVYSGMVTNTWTGNKIMRYIDDELVLFLDTINTSNEIPELKLLPLYAPKI